MRALLLIFIFINLLLNGLAGVGSFSVTDDIKTLENKISIKKAKTKLSYSEYSQLEQFFSYEQYKKIKFLLDKPDNPADLEKIRNKYKAYIKNKFKYISLLNDINVLSLILWVASTGGFDYLYAHHLLLYISLEIVMSVYLITSIFITADTDPRTLDLDEIAYKCSTSFSPYPELLDLYKVNKAIQYQSFQETKALLIALDLFLKELKLPNHQQESKILIKQALTDSKLCKKLPVAIKVLNDKNLIPNDEIITETNNTLNSLNEYLKKIINTVYIFINNEYNQKQYKAIINNKVSDLDEDHLNEYYSKLFKESNKD
ncbi:hypothetical protein [Lactobacillus taiwanensis]|uniref:hypothetical protein n=1 Tax=Lactobacillus taiwanensis TaxID=508451 RepID=UPI00321FB8D6